MKKKRKNIPRTIQTLLQKEIASVCPFCSNEDVEHFQFHHIDENPEDNNIANLLMLCPTCHSKITKGDITTEEVKKKKQDISTNRKDVALFVQELSPLIFDTIIFGEQGESRKINPWADNIRSRYKEISTKLREMSIQDVSIQKNWKEEIDALADFIDEYVNSKNHKRIGVNLKWEMKDVVEKAKLLKGSKIDPFFVSQRAFVTLKKDFLMQLRMLKSLNDRAETMLNEGRIKELQSDASKIGHNLLILSMYNTEEFPGKIKEKLYDIAEKIHLMEIGETHTVDKQKSFRNLLNELCEQLNALAIELPSV